MLIFLQGENFMPYEQLFDYVKSLSPEEFKNQIKNKTFADNYIKTARHFTFVKAQ